MPAFIVAKSLEGTQMKPYYQDNRTTIFHGDCLQVLKELPSESVQCCVTSPPYWGLRDYGTGSWDGGNHDCNHQLPSRIDANKATAKSTLVGSKDSQGHLQEAAYKDVCGQCGAVRIDNQLGLEKTPEEYTTNMVAVFREVKRVLRKDGVLFLNLGDSYFGGGRGGNPEESEFRKQATNVGSLVAPTKIPTGCKAKDLAGVPWMLAFALR